MYTVEYWPTEDVPTALHFQTIIGAAEFIEHQLQDDSSFCVTDFRIIYTKDVSEDIYAFINGEY